MTLPEHVHDLPIEFTFDGETATLHPVAIETDRGLLLVDAGLPHTTDQLAAGLEAAGFSLAAVALVLVTHQDGDHAGGLGTVLERTDPTVLAHERAAPVVDGRTAPRGADADDDRYPPARVDVELAGPVRFHTRAGPAEVVPTPGHTPGHLSLYLPDERFLLAVDALNVADGRLVGPRADFSEDMDTAMASVGRLAELAVDATLCYHGGLVAAGDERIATLAADSGESAESG